MVCSECNNPLRIIKGGMKSDIDSTDIVMVHVFGCVNKDCSKKMEEVEQKESLQESFKGELKSVIVNKEEYENSVLLPKQEHKRLQKIETDYTALVNAPQEK